MAVGRFPDWMSEAELRRRMYAFKYPLHLVEKNVREHQDQQRDRDRRRPSKPLPEGDDCKKMK